MDKFDLFVPGRLCLFGEHSDWAGKYRAMNSEIVPGVAIVTGTEQGIYATAEKDGLFKLTSEAPEIADVWNDFSCKMDLQELKDIARSGSFFSYCAGVASYMLEWYKVGGVHIHLTSMTLPMKSGLSSSAAICVLVCRAFNQLYKLNLNTMGEMNIAYWGELRTASRCGRLDQACAFGVRPVKMTFDAEEVDVENFNIKKALYWVFSDLNAEKDTKRILADLNKAYPFASNEMEEAEHKALGEMNQDIIHRAIEYMRDGKDKELGLLMTEAQEVFDKYIAPMCPSQLKSPKLHQVLADEKIKDLVLGGKGVGSQGDGSIQFLAKSEEDQHTLIDYLRSQGMHAYPLTIKPKHSIRKAIIPVAGFGTRLYPETRILKKDFFPIIDKDGLVKPVILILLEELVNSGIEEVCLVLGGSQEREQYRQFFETPLAEEHKQKLNRFSQNYERHILEIGKKLHYVIQTEKRGFGDAVYRCAADFARNEAVLLMLGDTLYESFSNKSCALQFIEAYERLGVPMVAIQEVPLDDVSYYGILSGDWANKEKTVLQVSNITEKPSISYAEEFLGVQEGERKKYYSVFGQYIITPEIFAQLHDNIQNNVTGDKGEIELTTALEQVREKMGMMGVLLNGQMYDMGNPKALRHTLAKYGMRDD